MNNPENPFIYGPPVPSEKFIGRETEIDHILGRLANPNNRGGSMVSGPPGIGKTSLLHYLFAEDTRRPWKGLRPDVTHFIYMPTHFIVPFSEIEFWEFLFDAIEAWLGSIPGKEKIIESLEAGKPPSRFSVSSFFTKLGSGQNKFVVALLDGFDLLMREINKDDSSAGLGFLHTLRALLNLPAPRGFSLITSSERDLIELFKDVRWFGSDFCNNMVHLPLGSFDETQINHLIDSYLVGTGINFDDDDRKFLEEVSSGHPKELQQAAYLLFEKKATTNIQIKAVSPKGQGTSTELDFDVDFDTFDVFLAHNDQDKPLVEAIAKKLVQRRLKPWLDKWHLPPGRRFAEEIERVLPQTKSVAMFVGVSGIGPWQDQEMYVVLDLFAKEQRPIIPVLLPGIKREPELPLFLRQFNWVRFATSIDDDEAMSNLVWGITGKHPRAKLLKLVKTVVEAYKLLIEIAQDVFNAVQIEAVSPFGQSDELKTILGKKIDLVGHEIKINEIKPIFDELKHHKHKWNGYRKEEDKLEVSPVVKDLLKQARENEERDIKSKCLSLKQQLEELTGYSIELPGLG